MTKHYIPEDEWDLHIQSEGCPCNPSVGQGVYNDTILYIHFRFFSGIKEDAQKPKPAGSFNPLKSKAMTMIWKDSTSYSRDDKERVPTAWTTNTSELSITVVKAHIYYPGKWVMHCFAVGMNTIKMNIPDTATPSQAQELAVKMVKDRLEKLLDSLSA